MILIIDNYDSFTFNLVQYIGELGGNPHVFRNDEISVDEIRTKYRPDKIVISPGPGTPDDAGVSVDVIKEFAHDIPLLGVCLGHQAIAQAFGGRIIRAPEPIHGKASQVEHDGTGLFKGLPNPLNAGRYHSLIVDRAALPGELRITAKSKNGIVMGLAHRSQETHGIQFHPESILTEAGKNLLQNFLLI